MCKVFLISIVLLSVLSCEKIIEPKNLPEQEPRIVLNCILATDSLISVTLSSSKSILSGKDYKYINNGVCEVYEDGIYIQNFVFKSNGNYQGTIFPKAGKSYTIKAAASGFENVSATTSLLPVPKTSVIELYDTAGVTYIRKKREENGNYIISGFTNLRFKILDSPSLKDHYAITSSMKLFDSLGQVIPYDEDISPDIFPNGPYSYDNFLEINGKDFFEGKEVSLDLRIQVFFEEMIGKPSIKRIEVLLQVLDLNEDYHKYYITLRAQATTRVSYYAEPVQVYTNVEKGLGILAGESILTIPVYSGSIVNK